MNLSIEEQFTHALRGERSWNDTECLVVPEEPSIWCKIFHPQKAKDIIASREKVLFFNNSIERNRVWEKSEYLGPIQYNISKSFMEKYAKKEHNTKSYNIDTLKYLQKHISTLCSEFTEMDSYKPDGKIFYTEYENYLFNRFDLDLSRKELTNLAKRNFQYYSEGSEYISAERFGKR